MIDYKEVIKNLTKKQREVFDQICVGNDKGHLRVTMQALVRKGLVERQLQKISSECSILRYTFANFEVHRAWCELCAEECGEEV